ncbi:MAG: dephospho-CoA kinase [Dysgonamonadaceae bacterium]|nr:dephospho-CoA kinase [Dysgonamonadaceae bacterium]
MKTIGLTGGIGSGKSIAARILETMGVPLYRSDEEAKRLTNTSPVIRKALTARFGDKLFAGESLDKPLLASLIFTDKENLQFVNSVIHPVVFNDFLQWKQQQELLSQPFIAIESAILFESGLDGAVDVIFLVSAPLETRIARVEKRDQINRASVLNRIRSQQSEEERIARSDYVLINDGLQALLPQIENSLKKLSY